MIKLVLIVAALFAAPAQAQSPAPPFCQGENRALQFTPAGWVCTVIAGVVGPQGPAGPQGVPGPQGPAWQLPAAPPPNQCITSHWDGTQWVCVPTTYLEAR